MSLRRSAYAVIVEVAAIACFSHLRVALATDVLTQHKQQRSYRSHSRRNHSQYVDRTRGYIWQEVDAVRGRAGSCATPSCVTTRGRIFKPYMQFRAPAPDGRIFRNWDIAEDYRISGTVRQFDRSRDVLRQ